MQKPFAAGLLAAVILGTRASGAAAQTPDAKQEKQAAGRQEPATLAVSIPWQWLASSGGTMSFQCEADRPADDENVKMIETLNRPGRRGRYSGKDEDGDAFTGTRNGDDFTFEANSKDGSKIVLQMPWFAARCLFGGAKLAGATSISLRAHEIGGRVRLEVVGQKKGVSVEVK
jgi:hypothetical protein